MRHAANLPGQIYADNGANALPVLHGLILTGGASTRMGKDKALLDFQGEPQLLATFRLLSDHVQSCFVSLRKDQRAEAVRADLPGILDEEDGIGPAAGLLAAHRAHPDAAWLVLACDLPLLRPSTLSGLIHARDGRRSAIAYRSPVDGLPEPLCALWEPPALASLSQQVRTGRYRLRDVLDTGDTLLLPPPDDDALDNINTPQDLQRLHERTEQGTTR
ncbi:MAG: NTP transferase domain-containing protein [Pseudoxanthomonas sp.]